MPLLLSVHYVAHRTILAVQTLFRLSLVTKIEVLLQVVYNYYAQSLKWYLEITKLPKFLEKKMLKILFNVKTHWISMLFPIKCILVEYKSVVMHMFDKQASNTTTKGNLDLPCGMETFFRSELYHTFA